VAAKHLRDAESAYTRGDRLAAEKHVAAARAVATKHYGAPWTYDAISQIAWLRTMGPGMRTNPTATVKLRESKVVCIPKWRVVSKHASFSAARAAVPKTLVDADAVGVFMGNGGKRLVGGKRLNTAKRGSRIQSLVFPRAQFTPTTAAKWALSHGFSARKVDVETNTLRIRQFAPSAGTRGRWGTIRLGASGVLGVVTVPKATAAKRRRNTDDTRTARERAWDEATARRIEAMPAGRKKQAARAALRAGQTSRAIGQRAMSVSTTLARPVWREIEGLVPGTRAKMAAGAMSRSLKPRANGRARGTRRRNGDWRPSDAKLVKTVDTARVYKTDWEYIVVPKGARTEGPAYYTEDRKEAFEVAARMGEAVYDAKTKTHYGGNVKSNNRSR